MEKCLFFNNEKEKEKKNNQFLFLTFVDDSCTKIFRLLFDILQRKKERERDL